MGRNRTGIEITVKKTPVGVFVATTIADYRPIANVIFEIFEESGRGNSGRPVLHRVAVRHSVPTDLRTVASDVAERYILRCGTGIALADAELVLRGFHRSRIARRGQRIVV